MRSDYYRLPMALSPFHPLIRDWFLERYGEPTAVQTGAWPLIAEGKHLLATAPTGSGKTLAAFLWSIDRLFTRAWEPGRVRVLYVSPLKALNNDVERNLLEPLEALRERFRAAGKATPDVRAATRSGDTPQTERRRMLRNPPEILITTPESLNILLTSDGGRGLLTGIRAVILDEIHAVAGSKRGTHLMTAVERLVLLNDEFQRIALSATVRPLERIARFVGGRELTPRGDTVSYREREVEILDAAGRKEYRVSVEFAPAVDASGKTGPGSLSGDLGGPVTSLTPRSTARDSQEEALWGALIRRLKERIGANRSTLIFTNSRRMAEKVTRFLNRDEPSDLAYSHHGSLSKEIRTVVESRFKAGDLRAIVATSSLELGIDIGDLDEVVIIQTPPSAAAAIQRIGRAGHSVGAVSQGRFFPLYERDLMEAVVVSRAVLEGRVETARPVEGALDVLAQVVLSMVANDTWEIDALYHRVRAADPYRDLPRRHFDLVLDLLAGRYADSRIRELTPRITIDRIEGRVRARRGARLLLYRSGGTIPDRGYFHLRLQGSMARIGELDEEFVWERSVGDAFTLGAQTWRIQQITHNDVLVTPAGGSGTMAPFWRGEELDRSAFFGERVGEFLEWAESRLSSPGRDSDSEATDRLRTDLLDSFPLDEASAEALVHFLVRQRAETGTGLPHRHRILLERVRASREATTEETLVLHTFWGGRVNRPFAIALTAGWEEQFGTVCEIVHDDDSLMLHLPHEATTEEILGLVPPGGIEELLRSRLEQTGFFGARFRENAGRALLLPRGGFRRRVPLWLNRQKAKRLLERVAGYGDFPVVLETWRTVLRDEMEVEVLRRRLTELVGGTIRVDEAVTSIPSPFAANLRWKMTNKLMYEDDSPEAGTGPALGADLVRELVFESHLRPGIDGSLVELLERKLQRLERGYAPEPAELPAWLEERILLPEGEWEELLDAVRRDHGLTGPELEASLSKLGNRILRLRIPSDEETPHSFLTALAAVPRILTALGRNRYQVTLEAVHDGSPVDADLLDRFPEPSESPDELPPFPALLAEWLRFYGPLPEAGLESLFSPIVPPDTLPRALEDLVEARLVVVDEIRAGAREPEVCDAENLERLLRLSRSAARPELEALPLESLPHFLAVWQGMTPRRKGVEGLRHALERLLGFPAPADAWETELLPARLDPYHPAWLDSLLQESDLLWVGCGRERLTFLFPEDLDLIRDPENEEEAGDERTEPPGALPEELFRNGGGHRLEDLLQDREEESPTITEALWEAAWQGRVTNDTFTVVRDGIDHDFRPRSLREMRSESASGGRRRRRFARWQKSRALAGRWLALEAETEEALDPLEEEERNKERARLLLARYGVVFRELLSRERPAFRWSRLFRALRLLELSGEIVAGHFFEGVPGLQFATPSAVRRIREGLPEDLIYWMNAIDPASPSGTGLEGFREEVPHRIPSSHMVFHGSRMVLVSEASGKRLDFRVPPDDPSLPAYLEFLTVALGRRVNPRRSVEVEKINDEPAARSAYLGLLKEQFQVSGTARGVRLWRRYQP